MSKLVFLALAAVFACAACGGKADHMPEDQAPASQMTPPPGDTPTTDTPSPETVPETAPESVPPPG